MNATRRRLLELTGVTTLSALAGCSMSPLGDEESTGRSYTLRLDSIDQTPVEHALFEPDEGALFGDPHRTAIDEILPDGQYTTYGFEPLPEDAYLRVQDGGPYYQTDLAVTGRETIERPLVRLEPLSEAAASDDDTADDPVVVESLPQPTSRVLTILYTDLLTNGNAGTSELLDGDTYVLRRPAELDGRLADGSLDRAVVKMDSEASDLFQVQVDREAVLETAHTAFAVEIAATTDEFREVVFAARIDAELDADSVSSAAAEIIDQAMVASGYTETEPLSAAFEGLREALGVADTAEAVNGLLLWYDGQLYRYGLYISEPS